MPVCHKHDKVEKDYRYKGEKCDWCERVGILEKEQVQLDGGERVWTVVTEDVFYASVAEARKSVEKRYPGFRWDFAGVFMETAGFGTYMNKEERAEHGLDK